MSQFSVHTNLNSATKEHYPLLIDIQNALLDSLDTKLVIPLVLFSKYESKPIKELMPVISINGKKYIVLTPLQAGINKKFLGNIVADLSSYRQDIISAIDFLITGF
jgi:CcdB protein.